MKTIILTITIFALAILNSCKEDTIKTTSPCVLETADSSSFHPKNGIYQNLINQYVAKGIPGITLLIQDQNGTWIGSAGKADIENAVDMNGCTVSKVASITKMYIATLVSTKN
ncbi:MAG: serine hydrolase [Bacteroidales bacterium]|nr:serine hydrolase [Bacteroidales bacterium]